jgi:hypothetical protein
MTSFISNPIAYGVRSADDDTQGGPLIEELVQGAGITLTEIDVGGGNKKVRISASGASGAYVAVTNPTPQNDDIDTAGIGRSFIVGDHWINSALDLVFICVNSTTNNAIWVEMDYTNIAIQSVTDDAVTNIDLGNHASIKAVFIYYNLTIDTRRRCGIIYITHNSVNAENRDEYAELVSDIPIVSSADINGALLRLNLTAAGVGGNAIFAYGTRRI